jgi:hypothetical protein
LQRTDESLAVYQVLVFAPDGEWQGQANVRIDGGEVDFANWSAPPPEWLESTARALLRTLWRNQKAGTAWPRRITRWRNEPT